MNFSLIIKDDKIILDYRLFKEQSFLIIWIKYYNKLLLFLFYSFFIILLFFLILVNIKQ